MTSDDEGGYVHDPSQFDEDGDRVDLSGVHPEAVERTFDRRGWVLVGVMVVAFVFAPLAILLYPPDGDFLFALIVLPLVPALLLAVTAVWATTRP